MPISRRIAPCLWFDSEAEEAANFYVSIFPDSRITQIARYGEAGFEHHHKPPGSVMTVAFELDGQPLTALNGGPVFRFNEAISLQVSCDSQAQIDHFWQRLGEGGDPRAQQCGWLKDRFGLSWQVVPSILPALLADNSRGQRVMQAVLAMKKIDLDAVRRAAD